MMEDPESATGQDDEETVALLEEHAELSSQKRLLGLCFELPEAMWAIYGRALRLREEGSPTPDGPMQLRKRPRPVSLGAILPPEEARAQRLDDIWRMCSTILLKKLWISKFSPPFLQPVDPVRLAIPDYFNYVSRPMDLRTIREKLANLQYASPLEFRDDVRQVSLLSVMTTQLPQRCPAQIWLNCTLYNHPNTPVRIMGDALSGNCCLSSRFGPLSSSPVLSSSLRHVRASVAGEQPRGSVARRAAAVRRRHSAAARHGEEEEQPDGGGQQGRGRAAAAAAPRRPAGDGAAAGVAG